MIHHDEKHKFQILIEKVFIIEKFQNMLITFLLISFTFSFTVDDFDFEISEGEAIIVSSKCPTEEKELIIPETVKYNNIEYKVTTIGNNCFQNCLKLIGTLNFPQTIKSIGSFAFSGCTGFTGNLHLPSSITSIST